MMLHDPMIHFIIFQATMGYNPENLDNYIAAFRETNRKKHRGTNGQTFAELYSILTDPNRFPTGKDQRSMQQINRIQQMFPIPMDFGCHTPLVVCGLSFNAIFMVRMLVCGNLSKCR